LAYIAIGFFSAIAMRVFLKSENAKRERGECNELIRSELQTNGDGDDVHVGSTEGKNRVYESVEEAKREKGDMWSGIRYSL
jgi:hypothetical protein